MVLYYSCTDITVEDAIRTGNMDALKMLTASPGVTRIDNIYDLLWLSIITGQKGRIDVFEYVYILCCDSNDNTENMFIEVMRSNSPRCIQAAIDTDLFVHFTKMYVYAYTKKMYIATQILEKMFEDSKDLYKFYRLMCAAKQFQSLDFIENVLKKYDSFTRTNFRPLISTICLSRIESNR